MYIKEISYLDFDEYSLKNEMTSFYQTSKYALIMAEYGFDYDYIGIFDGEKLIGASLILIKEIKKGIKYGYAPKGFLIDYNDNELLKESFKLITDYYYEKGISFIKINPNIIINEIKNNNIINDYSSNKNIIDKLEYANCLKLKSNLYFESSLPRFNAIIDLKNYNYNNLSKNTRNKINKSQRKGLVLEKGNIEDLKIIDKLIKKNKSFCDVNIYDFYNVFNKTNDIDIYLVRIDYEELLINTRQTYDKEIERNNMLNQLIIKFPTEDNISEKMNSDLTLLAYKNDILEGTKGLKDNKIEYIAAAIVIKYNDTATMLVSTFDRNYSRHNCNYYLYNEIINLYKNDYKYFDLNGMTGDFTSSNPYYGLNKFKMGFNSNIFEYIGEFDLIINENTYTILKETGCLAKEFNKKNDK